MSRKKRMTLLFITVFLLLCGCSGEKNSSGNTETLILGTLFEDSGLSERVAAFNSGNSNVQIEIKNYMEGNEDIQDAVNMIRMEIVSGKGPDLVNFGMFYSESAVSGGILEDLYGYMESDKEFKKDDYFENVWKSFSTGGNLYVMIPDFHITTFASCADELSGRSGWDINALMEYYEARPEETILFPGETKIAVFGMICSGSISNYVNWSEGTCNFDSDGFQKLLTFADQFPLKLVFSEDESVREKFENGQALLFPSSVSDVFDTTKVKMLLGEKANFIGYPMDEGSGSIAEAGNIVVGIGKNCKNKQAAWQFVKSLTAEDYQDTITGELPVRRASLDKQLKQAMQPEYLEDGSKKVKSEALFEGEDPLAVYQITEEDAGQLLSIIEAIKYNSAIDRTLHNILLEEADIFFHGERSIKETADIIQNRASLYLKEKI